MAALDIGTYRIKLVVAEIFRNKLHILSVSETDNQDNESEEIFKEKITKVFKDAETKLGLAINKIILTIPSNNAAFYMGEATIQIDDIVKGEDIKRVIKESTSGMTAPNELLVSITPSSFKLDNDYYTKKPLGEKTTTLSVRTVCVTVPKTEINPLLKIIHDLNINVKSLSFKTIGDYYTYKDNFEIKESSTVGIIDIGYKSSELAIFNKGVLTNVNTLNIGGIKVASDISYVYKIPLNEANSLVDKYTKAIPYENKEIIKINNQDIKIEELSKIAYARLKEIISVSLKELKYLTKKEIDYVIITGGITEMPKIKVLANEISDKLLIYPINILGARNNKYASALGIIIWYNEYTRLQGDDYSIFNIDEQEKLSGVNKQEKITDNDNSLLGKVFGYFLDD